MMRIRMLMSFLALFVVSSMGAVQAQDDVTIDYWMWNATQFPHYEACAVSFMEANPNITVQVEQRGWDDYWTTLTTGFVTGDAPDVFVNHLSRYPEFVELEQIVDLQPWVEQDGLDTSIYFAGLAELWTRDGARYGLPKDWDTIGVVYNVEMFEAAGIDPAVMATDGWTWNPQTGGTFEEVIAQLTLDANGNNALSPDFDAENIVQYGYVSDWTGATAYGQTSFSAFAVSTGWTFNNGIWGDQYFYNDERFINTIDWFQSLMVDKNYHPPMEDVASLGHTALFQSARVAMVTDGSWKIGTYLGSDFEVGFGRLPIGPEGRKSMFNGLADSIWVGTEHPEAAWEWVKFLGSADCQNIIGESAVVFPAIPEATDLSLQVRQDAGVDVSAFVQQAQEPDGTFLFPITDFAGEITTIMDEAIESIGLGIVEPTEILPAANDEINSLF